MPTNPYNWGISFSYSLTEEEAAAWAQALDAMEVTDPAVVSYSAQPQPETTVVGVKVAMELQLPLDQRPVQEAPYGRGVTDVSPGRRLRVFSQVVRWDPAMLSIRAGISVGGGLSLYFAERPTYAEAMRAAEDNPTWQRALARLPLTAEPISAFEMVPAGSSTGRLVLRHRDPSLAEWLQDLGDEINEDIHDAAEAFSDPDIWYPGIDEGIEPVSDEHVRLVIAALQRELNRELRIPETQLLMIYSNDVIPAVLPAAPLAELPWRVQRALAERRRWRYRQFGIGVEQWREGHFSLWEVPVDEDWVPRRHARLVAGA